MFENSRLSVYQVSIYSNHLCASALRKENLQMEVQETTRKGWCCIERPRCCCKCQGLEGKLDVFVAAGVSVRQWNVWFI